MPDYLVAFFVFLTVVIFVFVVALTTNFIKITVKKIFGKDIDFAITLSITIGSLLATCYFALDPSKLKVVPIAGFFIMIFHLGYPNDHHKRS